ncbi:MAG TPA: hypothetical protein VIN03_22650 [Roseateles sp.]
MQTCLVTNAEARAAARIEHKDALRDLAYGTLICEFMAGSLKPLGLIPTPDFAKPHTRFIDVLSDQMAGRESDQRWVELTNILVQCDAGRGWLRERAREHADWHADVAAYGG